MSRVPARRALAAAVVLPLALTACGRKGNPLPPLHPEPGHLTDVSLRRIDDRVEVRLTIPSANADGTTPSILDRVEIYGLALPASAPAPTPLQVLDSKNLRGRIEIRSADAKPAPRGTPDPRPAPGDAAGFIDRPAVPADGAASTLHYVVVGVAGGKRRNPVGPMAVPLTSLPAAPQDPVFTYDEQTLTLRWRGVAGASWRVYEADAQGVIRDRVPAAGPPLTAPEFAAPVVFGTPRCLAVRAIVASGSAVVEGPASTPVCVTPVDTFPPPVPSGLAALPADGSVDVTWEAVNAPDLAGYIVLRAASASDTLTPLTAVIPDLHYADRAVTRGTTYWYAVKAVDARGNQSAASARQSVTVRLP